MSRPSDYRLTVPEGWVRVGLQPGVREPAVARLVDRQFRGVDYAPQLKRQARDQFLRIAQYAYGNGGLELYVSLQTAGGLPLPASLVVTLTPPHEKETLRITPDRLAKKLADDGGLVRLAQLRAGPAVRVRQRAEATTLDVHVVVPESGAYLVLSFSTPIHALADPMVDLFDTIAGTLKVDPMSKDPSYQLTFGFPKGWVQLPVLNSNKVLERDKALQAWAAEQAQAMLGRDSDIDRVRHRAAELTRLTVGSRGRHAMYGLAFYPADAAGLLAILDVKRVVPDRTHPELTFDVLQELYAKRSAETVGDVEIEQTDLPSGPALRVRGKCIEQADEQGQGLLMEAVTCAILPPGLADAVVATMSWTALQLGDKLAEMADAIARTIRVTPSM